MSNQPQRRAADQVVSQLVADMETVKSELARNTEVTEQVRDILASFKTIAAIAKWVTAVAAAVTGLIAMVKTGGGIDIKIK